MQDRTDKLKSKPKGIVLAGFTGAMWGFSGVLGELLFIDYNTTPEWLVSNRLFWSGILILLYCWLVRKDNMFEIFQDKMNILRLLVLGIFGYTAIQYLFFVTVDLAGASLATILQFTAPVFVYLYLLFTGRKKFNWIEIGLVIFVFVGVILLVTRGQFDSIAITPLGIITGLGSGVGLAVTSIQPVKMIDKYGGPIVTGWAMAFAGILFQLITPVWQPGFQLDTVSITFTVIIIVFGTALAFLAYSASTKYIDSTLASIMTVMEPLVATFLSLIVFNLSFNWAEIIGIIIILGSVIALSAYDSEAQTEDAIYKKKQKEHSRQNN